ncbi:MAG: hypothetical protein C0525_02625 [Flavobacterium sp.]|jgi:hypothetical protein|uniref:hypothetical protein n=1 Tax=Flavobacterium sp. TaxID=239 RepID=UPI0025C67B4E|nr:hypothetical protein [Flavobacterium sp.]MBA4133600.1 hypothetical protein [Flavobacterium sp.]
MKLRLIFFLVLTLLFSSCDESVEIPLLNEAKVIDRMSSGSWKVTHFSYQNTTKTSDYEGVVFDFDAITVSLSNTGTTPVAGSWGVIDEGFEGNPELVLNLALTSVEPRFTNISDDWYIVESTPTKLRLKDENFVTGTIDYLTFQKL